jgi:hypothetical protein
MILDHQIPRWWRPPSSTSKSAITCKHKPLRQLKRPSLIRWPGSYINPPHRLTPSSLHKPGMCTRETKTSIYHCYMVFFLPPLQSSRALMHRSYSRFETSHILCCCSNACCTSPPHPLLTILVPQNLPKPLRMPVFVHRRTNLVQSTMYINRLLSPTKSFFTQSFMVEEVYQNPYVQKPCCLQCTCHASKNDRQCCHDFPSVHATQGVIFTTLGSGWWWDSL